MEHARSLAASRSRPPRGAAAVRRLAGIVAGGLLALAAAPSPAATSDAATVDIVAKRFEFVPNEVRIASGRTTTLRLRSVDVTHGFFNRQLGIDGEIEPGKTTEIAVTPKAPGRYRVICDHFCGAGHGNMNMTIVVE